MGGKTGLAIGLARKAALNGLRTRFFNAQDLLDELYASLADRTTSRLLNRLANFDILVIDELGYLSLKPEQANAFFKLMEMRYSRKSTRFTNTSTVYGFITAIAWLPTIPDSSTNGTPGSLLRAIIHPLSGNREPTRPVNKSSSSRTSILSLISISPSSKNAFVDGALPSSSAY